MIVAQFFGFLLIYASITLYIYLYHKNKNQNKEENQFECDCSNVSELDLLWNDIMAVITNPASLNENVLLRTFKFQKDRVNEDDKELVDFVRSLIVQPSKKKLNLIDNNRTHFSQIGQDKYIDEMLNNRENGFFIEAGAYDGEVLSNTLFFEMQRKWTGLLIEPLPKLFEQLLSKNRNAFALNACISEESKPFLAKFKVCDALSGIDKKMSKEHKKTIKQKNVYCNTSYYTLVPCFSLKTILLAINANKVDYFSLDVEGAELDVLKSLPLDTISIDAFTVEYNGANLVADKIVKHLENFKYNLTKKDVQDLYFFKLD
jgi:FkbM family methyltransferase